MIGGMVVLAIIVSLIVGYQLIVIGVMQHYHPAGPVPRLAKAVSLAGVAFAAALLLSSFAAGWFLWRKRSLSARYAFAASGVVALVAGSYAYLTEPPHPATYARLYAGQHYAIPWQYDPRPRGIQSATVDQIAFEYCFEDYGPIYMSPRCRGSNRSGQFSMSSAGSDRKEIERISQARRQLVDRHPNIAGNVSSTWCDFEKSGRRVCKKFVPPSAPQMFAIRSNIPKLYYDYYFFAGNLSAPPYHWAECDIIIDPAEAICQHVEYRGNQRLAYSVPLIEMGTWEAARNRLLQRVESFRVSEPLPELR